MYGCILALTLLSMMIKQAKYELDDEGEVRVGYRMDGSLISLRSFLEHMKTQVRRIMDHLFADDAALVAHTEQVMLLITSCFEDTSLLHSHNICLRKTVVLHLPIDLEECGPPDVIIGDVELRPSREFAYMDPLGCGSYHSNQWHRVMGDLPLSHSSTSAVSAQSKTLKKVTSSQTFKFWNKPRSPTLKLCH